MEFSPSMETERYEYFIGEDTENEAQQNRLIAIYREHLYGTDVLSENISVNYSDVYESYDNQSLIDNFVNGTRITLNLSDFKAFENITEIEEFLEKRSFVFTLVVCMALFLLILFTVIGNGLVIAAILMERHLKVVSNYLVLSLAVTDLLVASLVMPIGALYEILEEWTLGPTWCEIWTSIDVLCCTASILHLLAIGFDRYASVTNIDYSYRRRARHVGFMIIVVWIVSSIISFAPIFGWKDAEFEKRVEEEKKCLVSQDIGYQIFATFFSFYGPLAMILFLYYRIYQEAKSRIRRKKVGRHNIGNGAYFRPETTVYINTSEVANVIINSSSSTNGTNGGFRCSSRSIDGQVKPQDDQEEISSPTNFIPLTLLSPSSSKTTKPPDYLEVPTHRYTIKSRDSTVSSCLSNNNDLSPVETNEVKPVTGCTAKSSPSSPLNSSPKTVPLTYVPDLLVNKLIPERSSNRSSRRSERELKRENKAAKTLAVITGLFIAFWTPFFFLALLMPLCSTCNINPVILSTSLWLGYANSMVNPIIYTIFSPDFRSAFRKMIHKSYKYCGRSSII